MYDQSAVAVIVPVYNRSRTVIETLRSVARQTRHPALLLIVDDGSTDDLAGCIAQWLDIDKPAFPVKLARKENAGAPVARNFGLRMAGDIPFVAFLDSDDRWPQDFLERTSKILTEQPDAIAVSSDQVMVDFADGVRRHVSLEKLPRCPITWMFQHGAGIGSCTLLRTAVVRELGGYPEHVPTGHDIDLFFRASRRGKWSFAAGLPVEMGRNSGRIAGEHDHLCRSQKNFQAHWAGVYEDVARREQLADVLPRKFLEKHLAHRWYRAARQWERLKDRDAALDCYRRSIAHRRTIASWLRLHVLEWESRKARRVGARVEPVRKNSI